MSDPAPIRRGSYCTRCLSAISAGDLATFLSAQHLCPECDGVSDSTYAEKLKAAERGPRVPA